MIAGDKAPDFTLYDHTGRPRTLSALLTEGPVVLFFFPLASSPICTAQACHFRDLSAEFARVGAQRIGISTDTVDRQAHFARQRSFDYPLLSDSDGVVSELFGVRRGKLAGLRRSAAGRTDARRGRHTRRRGLLAWLLPVRRTTFVIDVERTVVKVISNEVRASVHADEALRFLAGHRASEKESQIADPLAPRRIDSDLDLAFEAPVEALTSEANPPHWRKNDVRSQLLAWSAQSPSVAELASRLSLPLGATRFLVDDLATQGYLRVGTPLDESSTVDERRELINRTLRGLRALRDAEPPTVNV
ncbi:peroxiredoxin [Mycobacterium paraterrae]|uniref:peroxiredoxin n=1 Tax=Mycobacterium paraterrae TaxID=577492 RepID=UPI00257595EB|nr:peroxiredoxin [Mycobacterium paraterrae]